MEKIIAMPMCMMSVDCEKLAKTSKVLLIALDEIPDVCSSCF